MTRDERAIEAMINIALSMREELAEGSAGNPEFARFIVTKVETELVDHVAGLRQAADRLRLRHDANGRALLGHAEALLRRYKAADTEAAAVLQDAAGRR